MGRNSYEIRHVNLVYKKSQLMHNPMTGKNNILLVLSGCTGLKKSRVYWVLYRPVLPLQIY